MAPQIKPEKKIKRVRVLRSFYWQGKPIPVGELVELPSLFCDELISGHKAELVDPAEPSKLSWQQKGDAERGGPETRFGPGGAPPPSPSKAKEKEKSKE